tara:strand:+ start:3216 stop:3965 length:750 start_codon:yes stop_codon:yes gene_type:complete
MFEHFDDNILFFEEAHKYKFKNQPDIIPLSVTGVIGKYKKPFDADFHAGNKADQLGVDKQQILDEWKAKGDFASSKGTLVHLYMEQMMSMKEFEIPKRLNRPDVINAFKRTKGICNKFLHESYTTLEHISAEQIVGCPEWGITGMIDQIVRNKINGDYYIIDWKTNKEIKESSPYKLTGSMSHLDSSELTIYSLQLGLYKRILEKYCNINIKSCLICHLPLDADTYKMYPIKNLDTEIDLIIKEHTDGL